MIDVRRLTAFHEAGHALAMIEWRGAFDYVALASDEHSSAHTRGVDGAAVLDHRWEARIMLAGLAAEEIFNGKPSWRILALSLPEVPFRDPDEYDVPQALAQLRLADPAATPTELTTQLLEEYASALAFLTERRAALAAVADALVDEGRLDCARVRALTVMTVNHRDH